MYAVIRTGGKQYRVAPGDVIRVETRARPRRQGLVRRRARGFGQRGPDWQAAVGSAGDRRSGRARARRQDSGFPLQAQETIQEVARASAGYTAVRITEIAFDGQSFKAPELPKKEPKAKKAADGRVPKAGGEGGQSLRLRKKRRPRSRRRRRLRRRKRSKQQIPRLARDDKV